MANGSMSSNSNGEGDIRAQIVEADLVSCMIALPTQLFRSTGIPVCLWFFAKDKEAGKQGSIDRTGQVLFIDARELGYLVDRAERALTDEEIVRIGDTYHAWRGSLRPQPRDLGTKTSQASASRQRLQRSKLPAMPSRRDGTSAPSMPRTTVRTSTPRSPASPKSSRRVRRVRAPGEDRAPAAGATRMTRWMVRTWSQRAPYALKTATMATIGPVGSSLLSMEIRSSERRT